MGDALALLSLLLFSCNAFVVRAASVRLEQRVGFLVALMANVAFAGAVVCAQLVVQGRLPTPSWGAVGLFALGGILSTYLGRRGYFRSVQSLGPSRAAAVAVTNPVFAFVFAWALLGERLGPTEAVAMLVVVVGLRVTSRVPNRDASGQRSGGMSRVPVAVLAPALFAACCYALGNVARGAAVRDWNEPLIGGLIGALVGAGAYLLFHVAVRSLAADLKRADRSGVWLWVLAGTLTIAGQIALIAATAYIPVAVAVAISSALPVLVIPGTILFLKNADGMTRTTVLGALMVVAGVVTLVLR